ncbi:hypothetical protein CC1G_06171 [Coprinopsis cinerea okayama7|uniref:Uncharacterized protein n=1 Tax=Coprinopsis cinerea (strain Okayama-7 / 130 / ATCC MYA-4618 / FGSC 9003) TaxID=240176 RepID=A8NV26_COPC7|nr:hypothetical protein CC1G_06171 [Coprinopsis cinerea okayama7\|eukprot:XP_001836584.2 hypothetical protein CC1G_06171 [Coprinopsis cinerea okayama7\
MGELNKAADDSKPRSLGLVIAGSRTLPAGERLPTRVVGDERGLSKELRDNASTRSGTPHREDDELNPPVAMVRPKYKVVRHPLTVGWLVYFQTHSTTTPLTPCAEAGSSTTTNSFHKGAGSSTRSSISSTSRHLRFRSKSLFSLAADSSSAPASSSNLTTSNSSPSTSATASMINAAKALTRRLSSTALRAAMDTSSGGSVGQVSAIPEGEHDNVDQLDAGRTLRRKKRLGGPPPARASPTPPHTSTLKKRVSAATLNAPQPIAVSFMLGQRPSTPESEQSLPSPVIIGIEGEGPDAPPMDKGKGVDTPVEHEDHGSRVSKPPLSDTTLADDRSSTPTNSTPPLQSETTTAMSSQRSSMEPTPTSSQIAMPTLPSVPSPTSTRIGHPSRPYYSAIRKHCMSSPAPITASISRQTSSPGGSPTNSRPTSSTIGGYHPPSSFGMDSVPPFARRPLSMGAAPIHSTPAISNVIAAHSHSSSVVSMIGTQGMSVFDLEDDDGVFEDDDSPTGTSAPPSSFKPKGSGTGGRKSSSLSRAFGMGHKKRRTWSSGLLSGDNEASAPPSSYSGRPSAGGARRGSQGPSVSVPIGGSMSGETELRMSLAMMEQQERERQQLQQREAAQSEIPVLQGTLGAQRDQKFRFRRTMEFPAHQTSAADDDANGRGRRRSPERQGTPPGSPSNSGVLARVRKFRKGIIKGFLGSSSGGGSTSAAGAA